MASLGTATAPLARKPISSARLNFKQAIARFKSRGPEIKNRLTLLRASSALGKRAVENIYAESRLTWSSWKLLFNSVLGAPGSPKSIGEAISVGLRSAILSGPTLPTPWPTLYGRAITTDRFSWHLYEIGAFASHTAAKRWLNNQIGKKVDSTRRKLQDRDLGSNLMWATFNRSTRGSDPFFKKPSLAEELRGVLGLPKETGKPLLLLEYKLPSGVPPLIPTIADAYAGELTYYFAVLPAHEDASTAGSYPATLPWQEYESMEPRPEVVHDIIKGTQINGSFEELA